MKIKILRNLNEELLKRFNSADVVQVPVLLTLIKHLPPVCFVYNGICF